MKALLRGIALLIFIVAIGAVVWRWRVNGWGSFGWLATIVLISVIRAPFAKQTATNTITETREARLERALLALVAIGGTFLPLLQLATGVLSFANYSLPSWATFIGVALLVPGGWLFWRSHADLGLNWSVTTELREDQSLTTNGVYAHVRHPMYAAIWILFGVQPLFVHNWIAGWSGVATFALMYFMRIRYEEAMMRDRFGAAYDDYCNTTGRLWPKL